MFKIAYAGLIRLVSAFFVAVAGISVLLIPGKYSVAQDGPELLDRTAQTLSGLPNDSNNKSLRRIV